MPQQEHITKIASPKAIAKILARHYRARGRFYLSTIGGRQLAATAVVGNDPDNQILTVDAVPSRMRPQIENASRIRVQGPIGALFSWFETDGPEIVREDSDTYYELKYPAELFQLQRRAAFRVKIPKTLPAIFTARIPYPATEAGDEDIPLIARIADLSAVGLAIVVEEPTSDLLPIGARLSDARIHIHERLPDLEVAVEVRNRRRGALEREKLIGLSFREMASADALTITRCIMALQREALVEE